MVNNVYKCDTDNVEKAEGRSEKSKIQFLILNSDFSFNNASINRFISNFLPAHLENLF